MDQHDYQVTALASTKFGTKFDCDCTDVELIELTQNAEIVLAANAISSFAASDGMESNECFDYDTLLESWRLADD